jgi:N-acetylglucosaminyldiphosphoundecaprenol N-acetyl-beta-D-mannosaminyltransferase
VKILDITINQTTKGNLFKDLMGMLLSETTTTKIHKINTEFLVRSKGDKNFKCVLNNSCLNIADGRGVLWAARYLTLPISNMVLIRLLQAVWQMIYSGLAIIFNSKFITYPIKENIPGVEAFKLMLRAAIETDSGVFLFGATQTDLGGAITNIQKEFPKLKISGSLNGYDFQKDKSIDPVQVINKTEARLLIVALGSPKQEYWIRDNIDKLKNVKIAVGEGGTLDRIANPSQKSPKFLNMIGLEWLWRLLFNKSKSDTGSRLKRVWYAVPVFIYEVVKWKIRHGSVPVDSSE